MKGVWLHGMFGGSEESEWLQGYQDDLIVPELHELGLLSLSKITELVIEHWAMPDGCLIGYSMGGRLALECFLASPASWKGVILLSAHPGLNSAEEQNARQLQDRQWKAFFDEHDPVQILESWESQAVFRNSDGSEDLKRPMPADWLEKRKVRLTHQLPALKHALTEWSVSLQRLRHETIQALGSIDSVKERVTWITGANDPKFLALAENLPGTHVVIPQAGHRLHLDQPEAVLKEVCQAWHRIQSC